MKKKFLYKNPTNPTVDNAAGTIFFNKQDKTISVGGDEMYPNFVLGHDASYTLTDDAESDWHPYITNLDANEYKRFIHSYGLDDTTKVAAHAIILKDEYLRNASQDYTSLCFRYSEGLDALVQAAQSSYSGSSSIDRVEFYNYSIPTITFENLYIEGNEQINGNFVGYVRITDTIPNVISALEDAGIEFTSDSMTFDVSFDGSEVTIKDPTDSSNSITVGTDDLPDFHIEYDFEDFGSSSSSWSFGMSIDNDSSNNNFSATGYDTINSSFEVTGITSLPMFLKNTEKAVLYFKNRYDEESGETISYQYLDVEVTPEFSMQDGDFNQFNYLTGITLDFTNYDLNVSSLTDSYTTLTYTVVEELDSRGGTVPAPTAENTVLYSDGTWKSVNASDVWDEYEE